MGFSTDDVRIQLAYELAGQQGIAWEFICNETETELHPNTVDIRLRGESGKTIVVRGESLGGGKIRITSINGIHVDFTGEYNTLIVVHRDCIGMAAHTAGCLSEGRVNIAFMKLFRESRGDMAYSIVEFDGMLPPDIPERIKENPNVEHVMLIQIREEE